MSKLSSLIDPEWDAYKRGAFLEQTNRFDKDKPSDVPGEYGIQIITSRTDGIQDRVHTIPL